MEGKGLNKLAFNCVNVYACVTSTTVDSSGGKFSRESFVYDDTSAAFSVVI